MFRRRPATALIGNGIISSIQLMGASTTPNNSINANSNNSNSSGSNSNSSNIIDSFTGGMSSSPYQWLQEAIVARMRGEDISTVAVHRNAVLKDLTSSSIDDNSNSTEDTGGGTTPRSSSNSKVGVASVSRSRGTTNDNNSSNNKTNSSSAMRSLLSAQDALPLPPLPYYRLWGAVHSPVKILADFNSDLNNRTSGGTSLRSRRRRYERMNIACKFLRDHHVILHSPLRWCPSDFVPDSSKSSREREKEIKEKEKDKMNSKECSNKSKQGRDSCENKRKRGGTWNVSLAFRRVSLIGETQLRLQAATRLARLFPHDTSSSSEHEVVPTLLQLATAPVTLARLYDECRMNRLLEKEGRRCSPLTTEQKATMMMAIFGELYYFVVRTKATDRTHNNALFPPSDVLILHCLSSYMVESIVAESLLMVLLGEVLPDGTTVPPGEGFLDVARCHGVPAVIGIDTVEEVLLKPKAAVGPMSGQLLSLPSTVTASTLANANNAAASAGGNPHYYNSSLDALIRRCQFPGWSPKCSRTLSLNTVPRPYDEMTDGNRNLLFVSTNNDDIVVCQRRLVVLQENALKVVREAERNKKEEAQRGKIKAQRRLKRVEEELAALAKGEAPWKDAGDGSRRATNANATENKETQQEKTTSTRLRAVVPTKTSQSNPAENRKEVLLKRQEKLQRTLQNIELLLRHSEKRLKREEEKIISKYQVAASQADDSSVSTRKYLRCSPAAKICPFPLVAPLLYSKPLGTHIPPSTDALPTEDETTLLSTAEPVTRPQRSTQRLVQLDYVWYRTKQMDYGAASDLPAINTEGANSTTSCSSSKLLQDPSLSPSKQSRGSKVPTNTGDVFSLTSLSALLAKS